MHPFAVFPKLYGQALKKSRLFIPNCYRLLNARFSKKKPLNRLPRSRRKASTERKRPRRNRRNSRRKTSPSSHPRSRISDIRHCPLHSFREGEKISHRIYCRRIHKSAFHNLPYCFCADSIYLISLTRTPWLVNNYQGLQHPRIWYNVVYEGSDVL
jgi:hypothetical protein